MDGQSLLVPDLCSTRPCFQGDRDDVSQQCEQQHRLGIFFHFSQNASAPAGARRRGGTQIRSVEVPQLVLLHEQTQAHARITVSSLL